MVKTISLKTSTDNGNTRESKNISSYRESGRIPIQNGKRLIRYLDAKILRYLNFTSGRRKIEWNQILTLTKSSSGDKNMTNKMNFRCDVFGNGSIQFSSPPKKAKIKHKIVQLRSTCTLNFRNAIRKRSKTIIKLFEYKCLVCF